MPKIHGIEVDNVTLTFIKRLDEEFNKLDNIDIVDYSGLTKNENKYIDLKYSSEIPKNEVPDSVFTAIDESGLSVVSIRTGVDSKEYEDLVRIFIEPKLFNWDDNNDEYEKPESRPVDLEHGRRT